MYEIQVALRTPRHSGHGAEDGSEDGGDSKDDYEIKPRFRQYVKEKQFELKDFPQIGLNNAVIVPTKSKSMVSLTRPRAPSTPRMSVALTMEYAWVLDSLSQYYTLLQLEK